MHPVKEVAERFDRILRWNSSRRKNGEHRGDLFEHQEISGTIRPNWVNHVFPYDGIATLDYQWKKCLIPYWTELAVAKKHNVRIAIEMHPGWAVSDPDTLLFLREKCGESIGRISIQVTLFGKALIALLPSEN